MAAARKLAIRLYWMLRTQKRYPEIVSMSRAARGVPLASAQPRLGRRTDWATLVPMQIGDSDRRIMVDVTDRIDGWRNDYPPRTDSP